MMHSRLLILFLTAAEHLNITAAARSLNITQPALTRSIKQLEMIIGTPLFERLPNGVKLTRQGEVLARRVKLMELEYRHALAEIGTLEQGQVGEVRIGAGPVWITNILPPVIATFHAQYPKVKVVITGGVINTLVPALANSDIDLLCSTLDFPPQAEIVREPLIKIRHAVAARAQHPLFEKSKVTARDMAKYSWVVLAGDQIGTSRIGSFFVANGVEPPNIALETASTGLFKILQEGDFLAHFSDRMLPDAEKYGLKRLVHDGTFWESEAGIAYRKTNNPVRALDSFTSILRSSVSG